MSKYSALFTLQVYFKIQVEPWMHSEIRNDPECKTMQQKRKLKETFWEKKELGKEQLEKNRCVKSNSQPLITMTRLEPAKKKWISAFAQA